MRRKENPLAQFGAHAVMTFVFCKEAIPAEEQRQVQDLVQKADEVTARAQLVRQFILNLQNVNEDNINEDNERRAAETDPNTS